MTNKKNKTPELDMKKAIVHCLKNNTIYIITPSFGDFLRVCYDHGLPPNSGISGSNIIWVADTYRLFGRTIYSDDIIIKGNKYYDFKPQILENIKWELNKRIQRSKERYNAIQIESPNEGNVCKSTQDSKTLGEGNTKHKKITRKVKENKSKTKTKKEN